MKNFFGIIILLCLSSGCSDDLSRSKAASILKSNSKPVTAMFAYNNYRGMEIHVLSKPHLSKEQVDKLKNAGYLEKNFTDKAKIFVARDHPFYYLRLADVDTVKINGITKPADMMGYRVCTAQYEIIYIPNELGKILELVPDQLTANGTATFVMTDTGWKLEK
jgi:hypothetical protein